MSLSELTVKFSDAATDVLVYLVEADTPGWCSRATAEGRKAVTDARLAASSGVPVGPEKPE